MISKREVKYIQSLCHKKQRVADRLFIVEGEKAVDELLQSNWEVKQIYATASWKSDHEQVSAPVEVATMEQIQQMSGLITARNVLALIQMPQLDHHTVFYFYLPWLKLRPYLQIYAKETQCLAHGQPQNRFY